MVHKLRAKTQDRRIKKILDWVHGGPPNERMILFMDSKMNVDPERLREIQLQFYGKSKMSWHGSAIFIVPTIELIYNIWKERYRRNETEDVNRKGTGCDCGVAEEEQLNMFFVDHIPGNFKKKYIMITLPLYMHSISGSGEQ